MEDIIKLDKVTMVFYKQKSRSDSLKEYMVKFFKHQLGREKFYALSDISFSVKKGEIFGIVGFNGSGKSTLLKIVSGILSPTEGVVEVHGAIAPLIELGAGFDAELTARENIFLNGSVLGYSKDLMNKNFAEIIDFSELDEFVDVPIKNFSSGMIARLGFAIATITHPEILIVDEILGVGDYKFQKKCEKRINEMMANGTTVLIVSHSVDQIKRMCSRAIWIHNGITQCIGNADEVCDKYLNSNFNGGVRQ